MNILILNGSPRLAGNTADALKAVEQGISENKKDAVVESVNVTKLQVAGCVNCNACQTTETGCVHKDDTNMVIDKILAADVVVFGSPVYWWGITAQMKTVVDKMYCRGEKLGAVKKKVGLVAVGGDAVDTEQYQLIHSQFRCICQYLGWDLAFSVAGSASEPGDLMGNQEKMKELRDVWQSL